MSTIDTLAQVEDNHVLPDIGWYLKPRSFEKSGKLYERLGIRTYRKYFPIQHERIRSTSTQDLLDYENETSYLEEMHLSCLIVTAPTNVSLFTHGHYVIGAVVTALNVLVNVYPIMLQRYNRSRITNILERRESKDI